MTKEVEDIIRNKAYYELNEGERESVSEYAQNEEEFNNMQWFLTGTTAAFGGAKIEASQGLKKSVMDHLTESKKKKGFWLNSVGLFMLPTNKKIYQKPAFQLGIAAVLVVGLLFVLNPEVKNDGLAVNSSNDSTIQSNDQKIAPIVLNEEEDVVDREMNADDIVMEAKEAPSEAFDKALNEGLGAEFEPIVEPPVPSQELNDEMVSTFAAPKVDQPTFADAEVKVNYELTEVIEMEDDLSVTEEQNTVLDELDEEKVEAIQENRVDVSTRSLKSSNKGGNAVSKKYKETESSVVDKDASNDVPASASGAGFDFGTEWIKPKALHINKTKELNALFFIEK